MTLLEDARRLAAPEALRYIQWPNQFAVGLPVLRGAECVCCHTTQEHTPDCPVLSLPRMVAALEAAILLLSREPERLRATDLEWRALKVALMDAP